jgi:hypothetical protein
MEMDVLIVGHLKIYSPYHELIVNRQRVRPTHDAKVIPFCFPCERVAEPSMIVLKICLM